MNAGRRVLPLWFGLAVAVGIYIGSRYGAPVEPHSIREAKLQKLLDVLDAKYVDSVDTDSLLDATLVHMLRQLDPHSSYVSARDRRGNDEDITGTFEGIGIEFRIVKDTVMVMRTFESSPAAQAGLTTGTRLFLADEVALHGADLTQERVVALLKGPPGSKVSLTVRNRSEEPRVVEVRRGEVDLPSVEAALMLNDTTGFIKLQQFTTHTAREVEQALRMLKQKGMSHLIFDLRGNPGGLFSSAIDVASQFLASGTVVVKTLTRDGVEEEYRAGSGGLFRTGRLTVLIDRQTASSAEIVAGALQDHKRARVLGSRSFGKGLVQEEVNLPDGSRMWLTTSRYVTPLGRNIQRSYADGYDAYVDDAFHSADTGRSRGGISPDDALPLDDTAGMNLYFFQHMDWNTMDEMAFAYADEVHFKVGANSSVPDAVFTAYLTRINGGEPLPYGLPPAAERQLRLRFDALVNRYLHGEVGYWAIMAPGDALVRQALK